MNRFIALAALALALLAAVVGCSPPPAESNEGTPTYYQDVAPIITASCFPCHENQNIAPIAFPTYADARLVASVMAQEVESGAMPPWMPDDSCRGYAGKTTLAAADVDDPRLGGRRRARGRPDDPGPARPPTQMPLERVDVRLEMPVTFTQTETPDQLRCFTLDWPLEHDAFITGFTGVPGDPRVVHHITAFIAGPDRVAALAAVDEADPGPGWDCFSGPGPVDSKMVSSVPGRHRLQFPRRLGYAIKKGGKIVIQVHYNADNSGPHPDRSAVEFSVADHVAEPARTIERKDHSWIETLDIPADAPDTHVESLLDPGIEAPAVIRWVNLHQHYLGSESSLYLVRPDGSRECLLHIPNVNFHWQESYLLTSRWR